MPATRITVGSYRGKAARDSKAGERLCAYRIKEDAAAKPRRRSQHLLALAAVAAIATTLPGGMARLIGTPLGRHPSKGVNLRGT